MNLKQLLAGAALGAMVLASPSALAAKKKSSSSLTGNVGAVSEYMFRGVAQEGGAALQGGVDYMFDFGMYTGVWFSNAALAGGNEADLYAGYGLKLGDFTLEGGAIYYLYSEDTETPAGGANTDYAEIFVGGAFGPASLKIFYAPEFGPDVGPGGPAGGSGDPDSNELMYITASVNLTLTKTISIIPQVGLSSGDGAKDVFGDEYIDYSLTAVKNLGDGLSASLAVIGTNLDNPDWNAVNGNDDPKFVIGVKKGFGL